MRLLLTLILLELALASTLPEWFITQYSNPAANQEVRAEAEEPYQAPPKDKLFQAPAGSPAKLHSSFLDQSMEDHEVADTHQERSNLSGATMASARERLDPSVLKILSDEYTPTITGPKGIALEPFKYPTEPLTLPPSEAVKSTRLEGTKVFTDQAQVDKIMDEAPEAGRMISFGERFKRARAAGREDFEYKGDRFTTRKSEESNEQWLSNLKASKYGPDRRGQRAVSRRRMAAEASHQGLSELYHPVKAFSDYMESAGASIAEGKDVDVSAISSKLGPALDVVAPAFKAAGIDAEITSGNRGGTNWSLHNVGEAVDMRLKTADPDAIKKLEAALPGTPRATSIHGEKGRLWNDGTFDYVIHGSGDNIHLHIERETAEAKGHLAEHLIESGHGKNISNRGISRYPELLKKYGKVN